MFKEGTVKYECWPLEVAGGMNVSTPPIAVRAEHIESGIVAIVSCGRSQFHNRQIADDMLLAAITHPKFR